MKEIRVLQFTTHNEDCGIAKYQEQFVDGMNDLPGFNSNFFELSPNIIKYMKSHEIEAVIDKLKKVMKDYDILHIQHEISFFRQEELAKIVSAIKSMNKKIIVTVHTAPEVQYKIPKLTGVGPRSILAFVRQKISAKRFLERYFIPLKYVDLIIVHNEVTKKSLENFNISTDKIKIIKIPVPKPVGSNKTNEIRNALNYKKGDIIFCTVGFISEPKGVLQAVKALQFLPDNYKLAIIGGIHPQGGNEKFLDKTSDLIIKRGLKDRVYITGFVAEDAQLNGLIQETDICVYPFDKKYYSFVSSASLNNAIANHKPIIAYKTDPFEEVNKELPVITFSKSANYYELAKSIKTIDIMKYSDLSKKYAENYNYPLEAKKFIEIYQSLVN